MNPVYKEASGVSPTYWRKLLGGVARPPAVTVADAATSGVGGLIAIGLVAYLSQVSGVPWLMAPFGATCVLVFAAHTSPLSQPRSVIGGHLVSTLVGLVVLALFGQAWWSVALAVGLAITAMALTKTLHAPAGADPIVVITANADWGFLFSPVLIGAVAIVGVGLLYNNLFKKRRYPQFWV